MIDKGGLSYGFLRGCCRDGVDDAKGCPGLLVLDVLTESSSRQLNWLDEFRLEISNNAEDKLGRPH